MNNDAALENKQRLTPYCFTTRELDKKTKIHPQGIKHTCCIKRRMGTNGFLNKTRKTTITEQCLFLSKATVGAREEQLRGGSSTINLIEYFPPPAVSAINQALLL
ncbi:hypothetical protein TcasGA2_TC007041 [Tribolium castaneum]|uniref:Uncharacterized protein n=1 Tax=Tribolium castaneum TaxID=7070 RepID=D2A250_TRICA|nr:hypothetical protein TcasGA2_TC007041 [Tribolium castaneum]